MSYRSPRRDRHLAPRFIILTGGDKGEADEAPGGRRTSAKKRERMQEEVKRHTPAPIALYL